MEQVTEQQQAPGGEKPDLAPCIERIAEVLEAVASEARIALDAVTFMPRDAMKWMRLSKAVFDIHEMTREGWQRIIEEPDPPPLTTADPASGTGAFFTPPEVLNVVMANPPLTADPATQPAKQERHMSRATASGLLMEMARLRSMTLDQVTALEMGVRRLMSAHFQKQRNLARRREKEAAAKKAGGEA